MILGLPLGLRLTCCFPGTFNSALACLNAAELCTCIAAAQRWAGKEELRWTCTCPVQCVQSLIGHLRRPSYHAKVTFLSRTPCHAPKPAEAHSSNLDIFSGNPLTCPCVQGAALVRAVVQGPGQVRHDFDKGPCLTTVRLLLHNCHASATASVCVESGPTVGSSASPAGVSLVQELSKPV